MRVDALAGMGAEIILYSPLLAAAAAATVCLRSAMKFCVKSSIGSGSSADADASPPLGLELK